MKSCIKAKRKGLPDSSETSADVVLDEENDSEYIGRRMMEMARQDRQEKKRGRPKRIFLDVMKEDAVCC